MFYLIIVLVPMLVLTIGVQLYVEYVFGKWSQVENSLQADGIEVAERILRDAGLDTKLGHTEQRNGDHYDPQSHIVRLSKDVAMKPSVHAMAVAGHELGHAQQYEQNIEMIRYRSLLVPAIRFSPTISYALLMVGVTMRFTGMIWAAIAVFGLTLVFMFLTLPIEFDASRRGINLLKQSGLLSNARDISGVRQVLSAAALTYVAASALSIMELFRYLRYLRR